MKKLKLLSMITLCIILGGGCSTGGKAHTDDKKLPKEDHATELTIEVRDYNTYFYANAAKKFEEETGVKVKVINDFNTDSTSEELHANVERIQAELMAGKGADLYANTYIDYTGIGKNKHLCNLANWIENDPDFSEDAYYKNVLKFGFDKGDVYSIPLFIAFTALGTVHEVPELEGKSLNWEEFFALTKEIKRNGVLYGITDHQIFKKRFKERYDQFIDEENKTQMLDTEEMIKLLKQCKEWGKEGLCIPYDTKNLTEVYDKAFFKDTGGGEMHRLTNFRYDNPFVTDDYYFYDFPSDSGKNDKANKVDPAGIICINAASPYKATAWKFVKFLLREDIQASGSLTPVNRKAANQQLGKTLNEIVEYFKLEVDVKQIIKESEAILDGVQQVSDINFKTDAEKIVYEEAKRFYVGEVSAEAAAKSMAARVGLYLKEQ